MINLNLTCTINKLPKYVSIENYTKISVKQMARMGKYLILQEYLVFFIDLSELKVYLTYIKQHAAYL